MLSIFITRAFAVYIPPPAFYASPYFRRTLPFIANAMTYRRKARCHAFQILRLTGRLFFGLHGSCHAASYHSIHGS
jgi:hypothetical protein